MAGAKGFDWGSEPCLSTHFVRNVAEAKGFDWDNESYFLIRSGKSVAEAKGFEPSRRLRAHTISSRAPSTTRPRFHL